MRQKVAATDQQCDSCGKLIPAGILYHAPRKKLSKPKTRQQSIMRNHLPVRYSARHIECPPPELQVTCPTCLSHPGDPCIHISPFTTIDVKNTLSKPHNARVRAMRKAQTIWPKQQLA